MNEPQQSGDNISANISGNISGQVGVGKQITQKQTIGSTAKPEVTEAQRVELSQMFDNLKTRIEAEAPAEKKAAALERLDELKEAVTAKEPDLSTMEYVKNWFFFKNIPALAGAVTDVFVNPIVGKLVELAGEALTSDFRRRFRLK